MANELTFLQQSFYFTFPEQAFLEAPTEGKY